MAPFIPYGRQSVTDADIEQVVQVLRSDYLTTGPAVERFEQAVADYVGTRHACAVANGTAALHVAMHAAGIGPGDEVLVPPMTFAASVNAVAYAGATPVFVDVDAATLLIDPDCAAAAITPRTKALVAVDYAGQPCDYRALRDLAERHGLILIADACHSLGGQYRGAPCGGQADLSVFSFHPVKPITSAEGGMVVTDNPDWQARMRLFRNHGITTDHRQRSDSGAWFYEMVDLGYNYRLSDLHCALGLSQLGRLDAFIDRRRQLAARYDRLLADSAAAPLACLPEAGHGYHLYVVRVPDRDRVHARMRDKGIGCNVHYVPVHLHPWYRRTYGTGAGLCPQAEAAYGEILSLPIYPELSDAAQDRVVAALNESLEG